MHMESHAAQPKPRRMPDKKDLPGMTPPRPKEPEGEDMGEITEDMMIPEEGGKVLEMAEARAEKRVGFSKEEKLELARQIRQKLDTMIDKEAEANAQFLVGTGGIEDAVRKSVDRIIAQPEFAGMKLTEAREELEFKTRLAYEGYLNEAERLGDEAAAAVAGAPERPPERGIASDSPYMASIREMNLPGFDIDRFEELSEQQEFLDQEIERAGFFKKIGLKLKLAKVMRELAPMQDDVQRGGGRLSGSAEARLAGKSKM